jgi:hypothetical protein
MLNALAEHELTETKAAIEALEADGRTVYELAKATQTETDIWYRFKAGKTIRLDTAAKLAAVLGLELKPIKRTRKASRG